MDVIHEDPRDGFEKSLHKSAANPNNESNNSFDSDAHSAVVISPRVPSSYQLKRAASQYSQYSPLDSSANSTAAVSPSAAAAAAAALAAANAAVVVPPAAPSSSSLQAQVSPVFTRPKELPPTLSQEAMRRPSLTAQEFAQLVSQGDSSLSVLEQVKADRLSRRTNTDPSITATLSRSQEEQQQLQQKYYALPQNGSSHSLTPSNDSSLELKKVTYGITTSASFMESVNLTTPANMQTQLYNTGINPGLMSTQVRYFYCFLFFHFLTLCFSKEETHVRPDRPSPRDCTHCPRLSH